VAAKTEKKSEPAGWRKLLPPAKIPAKWRKILLAIPGYDPIATAGDARFDPEAAQRSIDFFGECLRHVEGEKAGQPFVLEPWQEAVVANLMGWKRLDEQGRIVRRYREAIVYVPRKNGKTPLVAGLALLVFFCDGEAGQQGYIAASEREQAALLFRQARGMVEREPELRSRCRIYGGNAAAGQSRSLVREEDGSFLRVIAADADNQHGGNTGLAIVEELHTQPNRDLVDVLRTSMASANRKQPLMVYVTTADYDRPSICNEIHDYASKVRDGIVADPSFLPVIYEAVRGDDWKDPATWAKANPNLGVSVSREYLERECKRAQENPAYENTYKRLHLNMKTEQAERIIPMDKWDACKRKIDRAALAGRNCYAGFDIGATSDFTALVLLFPHDDVETVEVLIDPENPDAGTRQAARRSYTMLPFFWLPEHPVKRDPRMSAQIEAWSKQGPIRRTGGDVVDYDIVFEDICKLAGEFTLGKLVLDYGFQGASIARRLMDHFGTGTVESFRQGIVSMASPFRELLELTVQGRLHHDGNPVLRWMASNVAAETKGGLVKPSKEKSAEKIDGITAATMALGIALSVPGPSRFYEDHDLELE
jgi:phage terminase large subunit-like protein